jgi:hypothetical protein
VLESPYPDLTQGVLQVVVERTSESSTVRWNDERSKFLDRFKEHHLHKLASFLEKSTFAPSTFPIPLAFAA